MLTLDTMLRAARQARSYGEGSQHFFDGRDDSCPPTEKTAPSRPQPGDIVRRWSNAAGAYVYVKKE